MKIKQAHIYGFGKWIDYTIDFSNHSFVCIFGGNETGKSTLQKFILFMLFGLPPRKREFYRPKQGSMMGGRITIHDDEVGLYTIERRDGVKNGAAICTVNGERFDEDWLKEQLSGLTEQTYQSIYSFSALDLIEITNMRDDDLGDILLGISLTGSSNLYSIEKRLDQKMGELFKPYGKNPLINKQLESLEHLQTNLEKFKAVEFSYQEKQNERSALEKLFIQIEKELDLINKKLLELEKQKHALPLIQSYQKCERQLSQLPGKFDFPENGLTRLQAIKEQLMPLKSEYTIVNNNIKQVEHANKQLVESLIEDDLYQRAIQIDHQKHKFFDQEKQIVHLKQRIDQIENSIDSTLNKLNIGISQQQLEQISFSFYTEQMWNDLKNTYGRLMFEKEQLNDEKDSLKTQNDYLKTEQMNIQSKLIEDSILKSIQNEIQQYESYQHVQQQLSYLKEQNHHIKSKKKKHHYALIFSLVISFILFGIASLFNKPLFYQFTLIVLMIGVFQWFFSRNSFKQMDELINSKTHTKLKDTMKSDQEIFEMKQVLSDQNALKLQLKSIQDQLQSLRIQLIKWEEKDNLLEQQLLRLEKQIEEQYHQFPFLKKVDIKYWPELYHSLKELIQTKNQQLKYIKEIDEFIESNKTIKADITEILNSLNIDPNSQTVEESFELLHSKIQLQKNMKAEMNQYKKQLNESIPRKKILTEKIKVYEDEMNHLFTIAQVSEEEHFHRRAKQWEEKQNLNKKLVELQDQLLHVFSKDHLKDLLNKDISQTELGHLEQKYKAKVADLKEQLEDVRQQLANLNAEIQSIESSEDYSMAMHKYHMELEQLRKWAYEWSILKTAKELLLETKNKYQKKYLIKVLDLTSYYFKHITNGAYEKVYAPNEKQKFRVESIDGVLFEVHELSRGTIDQLYVSLRIAISDMMSNKYKLPFIIDDAFLNFDSIRLGRMLHILKELSKKQQIILFTCHQSVVNKSISSHNIILDHTNEDSIL